MAATPHIEWAATGKWGGATTMNDSAEETRAAPGVVAGSLFAGGGEVGRVMASWDWSATPAGPPESWPASLRAMVRVLLTSRFSMWLGWGPELAFFYNDAYRHDTLRTKHPWALGRPAREVWAEIWDDIGPRIQSVLATGEATWDEQLPLLLERAGYPEETYHTFSYSPLTDDDGRVAGMLCVVREDTERVLGERRLRILRELGDVTAVTAPTPEQACTQALDVLARHRVELPVASVHLLSADRGEARLCGYYGVTDHDRMTPGRFPWAESPERSVWPMLDNGQSKVIPLARWAGAFAPTGSPVGEADPRTMVVLPLTAPGDIAPIGALALAISPFRVLDEEYRNFLELVAKQVSMGIADAQALHDQRRRAEELAELDRAKTEFFTGVSHELRTPLTLITGPTEEALADTTDPLSDRQRGRMELVARNGGRLRRLVDTLLEFSRLEGGALVPERVAVDLAALTRGLAESFAPAVHRAGLGFVVECPRLPAAVSVDADMWEKIVLNLLSNAVKYTLAGGVELTLRPRDAGLALEVRDTGTGIPVEEQPRLFERFYRVRGVESRSHEGSGIGLALVAELTALHGGDVRVDSAPGRGSTFTVWLPRSAWTDATPSARTASSNAGLYREEALQWSGADDGPEGGVAAGDQAVTGIDVGDTAGATVLVAEDNPDLRRFIAELLRPHYTVLLTADGRRALELARDRRPDLLLTDVMMPGLDGFALLAALRAHPATATIPVVVLSARAGQEAVGAGLTAGADDYLVKPFSSQDLLARVRSNLALSRLRGREGAWRTALLNALSDGFFVLDADGSVVEINGAFTEILGYGPEGVPYHPPHPWWPDPEREPAEHAGIVQALTDARALTASGRWQLPLRHRAGHRIWAEVSVDPVHTGRDGRPQIIGLVRDVTDRHRAAERGRALGECGRVLAEPDSLPERLRLCTEAVASLLDDLVVLGRTTPDGRLAQVAAAHPTRPELATAALALKPYRVPPSLRQRSRAGRPFVLDPTPDDLPHEAAYAALGAHTTLVSPLTVGGRLHGLLLGIGTRGRGGYDDAELAVIEELSRRIAVAMEADRVAGVERRLHDASTALAAAATVPEACAALATAFREATDAAGTAVHIVDRDDPTRARLMYNDGFSEEMAERFAVLHLDDPVPAAHAIALGEPIWLSGPDDWAGRYPALHAAVEADGVVAFAALPLRHGQRTLGVLSASFPTPCEFSPAERAFAATLVTQAAQAFERASRTDTHRQIARTLQHSLLPDTLPEIDRLALAAHYQPSGRDVQAGGDWYDVLDLPGGRVAVVVGDVVGNGPTAAAIMGKLSSALAAYLREGHGPGRALELLSSFARSVDQATGSTAICLVINTITGEVRGACAGHPPPLLLAPTDILAAASAEPPVYLHDLCGVALGIPHGAAIQEHRLTLPVGSSVLLYTDGLVERRREVIDDGLKRLADVAATHPNAAPADLLAAALGGCLPPDGPADDVALLIARYLPPPLHARVAARPEQLAAMRREVRSWANANGLPGDLIYDLLFALSEVVANSIEHAYPPGEPRSVSYELTADTERGVRASVHDQGTWRPPPDEPGHRGRGLAMLRTLASDVSIETAAGAGTTVRFTLPGGPDRYMH